MSFVVVLMGLMITADLVWWARAHAGTKQLSKRWRRFVGAWALLQIGILFGAIFGRLISPALDALVPRPVLAAAFIWHLIVLPASILLMSFEGLILGVIKFVQTALGRFKKSVSCPDLPREQPGPNTPALSRRALLGATLATVPPLVTVLTTGRAMAEMDEFRIRRIDLPVPNLPRDLDGVSIAQVTDVHVGRFTTAKILPKIAEATNQLRADLVVMTGDLINISIDDLPAGLDLVRQIDPRRGLFMIQGNHDLIMNPFRFNREVKEAGVPLLLDELAPIQLNGQPIDVLGLRWARNREGFSSDALSHVWQHRRADAFPILLAHHPHAFDAAAALGVPLTLSGHTHGGQLHLTDAVGFGPLMFRYWSGLYRKLQQNNAALVVSNGVGNWFPLRVNVPAEIVHVVLHRT